MKIKYLLNIVLATSAILTLNSCLKKRATTLDGDGPRNIIEFKNTGSNNATSTSFYPLYNQDLGSMTQGESKNFNINVGYSGENVAPSDITLTLALDQNALDRFNKENGTNYTIPPSDVFTFPASIVIKKGTRVTTDSAKVTLTANFDFNASYAIPLQITKASMGVISANFGSAVYSINIRNSYDGVYSSVAGTVQRYSSPTTPTADALSGSMAGNPDVTLTTVGPYTVEIGNLRWAGGTSGIAGIDHLQATVDPATNKVTMKALGNATLADIPGKQNSYDPATKTYTLNFDWNQTANKREVLGLVLKFKKER